MKSPKILRTNEFDEAARRGALAGAAELLRRLVLAELVLLEEVERFEVDRCEDVRPREGEGFRLAMAPTITPCLAN